MKHSKNAESKIIFENLLTCAPLCRIIIKLSYDRHRNDAVRELQHDREKVLKNFGTGT